MRIHIKKVDDWITVWKDGVLVWGNHRCSLEDGLDALGIPFEYEYREDFDDGYNDVQEWLDQAPSEAA